MSASKQERLADLLSDRALEGLSADERAELLSLTNGALDDESFDYAAAAVALATIDARETLPAHLAGKIEADAMRMLPVLPHANVASFVRATPRRDAVRFAGWAAAAACLALAAASWLTRGPAPLVITTAPAIPIPRIEPLPPTASAERAELLEAKDAIRVEWSPTKDPAAAGAAGDVVWSDAAQKGFMRFRGLAANDPKKSQYQLWIFDPSQSAKTPVDGGVFDVDSATGDVVVPITAKLHVARPTLFAVTVEKPGGVVVSKRERIVLTAAAKS
jgi:hypothetical protein